MIFKSHHHLHPLFQSLSGVVVGGNDGKYILDIFEILKMLIHKIKQWLQLTIFLEHIIMTKSLHNDHQFDIKKWTFRECFIWQNMNHCYLHLLHY